MSIKGIPDGFQQVIPYLISKDSKALIQFLKSAFAATEIAVHHRPDGGIMHAQMRMYDCVVMLSDSSDENKANQSMLYLYVEDADEVYQSAIAAGATSVCEPMDAFYGDRSGGVLDPAGNQWWMGTQKEILDDAEMAKRTNAAFEEKEASL